MLLLYKTKVHGMILNNKLVKVKKKITFKDYRLVLNLFCFNKLTLNDNLVSLFSFYLYSLIGLIKVSVSNLIYKKSYPLTLNRSPFANKKAKDQFAVSTNKVNLTLFFSNEHSLKSFKDRIFFLKDKQKIFYNLCSKLTIF